MTIEMEIASTIIGIALIAICALPFVLMFLNGRKTTRERLSSLRQIAEQQGHPVSKYDLGGDFIIGIDDPPDHVYFYKSHKGQRIQQVVDLNGISTCKVVKMTHTAGSSALLTRIELAFLPARIEQPETRLILYNEDEKASLSNELEIAEKWSKLIQERLKRA